VGLQLNYAPRSMTAPPCRVLGRTGLRHDEVLFIAAVEPALLTGSAHPGSGAPRCRFRSTAATRGSGAPLLRKGTEVEDVTTMK
jgi:hypothetical protein